MSQSIPDSTRTLVCFALKEEAAAFRRFAAKQPAVSILLTGIGKVNAEKITRRVLAAAPASWVLTCGFAGGLAPGLEIGTVVFTTEDPALAQRIAATGARPARFFCADRIATTVIEKQELRRTSGADVVEMESAVIHKVCRELGIPCATVRVISDTANEDLPLDFNQLSNPDQSLNFSKLAGAILKAPGKIPGLLRLQKKTRQAAENLARVLTTLVARP